MAEFLAVALAHFLALLSPGPDFFIIISAALRNGSKRAVLTCFGIALANGVYISAAVAGLSLVQRYGWLLTGMRIGGACFLCYLGFMLLRSGRRELFSGEAEKKAADSGKKLFMTGFMSAALNPKNPIFYMSLYSLFISPDTGAGIQVLYGLWMFFAVFMWDSFVAFSIGSAKIRNMLNAYTFRIEQMSGAIIIILGILIAL